MTERVYLNWGAGADHPGTVLPKGKARKCITCGGWTMLLNPDRDPQHKVCAEKLIEEGADDE